LYLIFRDLPELRIKISGSNIEKNAKGLKGGFKNKVVDVKNKDL